MKKKAFSGSVTIEATLALAFFIFGYMCILSLVCTVRAECAVQCGIDRTAADISRYCYAAERLGFSEYLEKSGMTVGEAIDNISGLSGLAEESEADDSSSGSAVAQLADMLTGGKTVGGIIAEPVIRLIFAENVAGDRENTDKYLEDLAGITTSDIDFRYSSLLKDGNTIEIVAVYKVKLKTFGLMKNGISLTMKNTAATSAWLHTEAESETPSESKWQLGNFQRGKAWIEEIKSENKMDAVKSGKGIDLYRLGTYTMINSINIFNSTYSSFSGNDRMRAEYYTIKEKSVENQLIKYSEKLLECIKNNSGSLQNEAGIHIPEPQGEKKGVLLMILPEEAGNSRIKKTFENIAEETGKKYGISIVTEYREKALIKGEDEK